MNNLFSRFFTVILVAYVLTGIFDFPQIVQPVIIPGWLAIDSTVSISLNKILFVMQSASYLIKHKLLLNFFLKYVWKRIFGNTNDLIVQTSPGPH